MILFQPVNAPRHHARSALKNATWLTWSDRFLKEQRWIKQQSSSSGVALVHLKAYQDYNYTYSLDISRLDKGFVSHMLNYAYELYHFSPGENIVLFTGLLNRQVSGASFHFLFALFRELLASIQEKEMGALYAPLSKDNQEEFPLHCDLYIPRILFNVFEDVAADGKGHSTFLSLDTLFDQVLPQVRTMDARTVKRLKRLVYDKTPKDNYQEFFDTLYDRSWSAELQQVQKTYKSRILFRKGEGYMVHDRVWMHGREKTRARIGARRLHRLVFDCF